MFRTVIYPSSGACDCVDELPHRSSCSQFIVCWRFGAAGFGWCSFCRLQNEHHLMMDILMSETCWAHKNWNKIASDMKLVFHSSTITMMHGPINIRYTYAVYQIQFTSQTEDCGVACRGCRVVYWLQHQLLRYRNFHEWSASFCFLKTRCRALGAQKVRGLMHILTSLELSLC